ncbi:hypothetical protein GALL_53700 [mine drainage metagenome]|uniref:Uncharacterized protein n=1 Tax=mine drainage metagenome TaxID=410659 RepID=A0A1J5SYC3_9ZZZZ
MSVIPLTLTISLCLVITFVVFFLREHARSRMSSPERDSLLPFGDEKPRARDKEPAMVISFKDHKPGGQRRHEGGCHSDKPDHERCPDCRGRHS